MMRIAYFLAFMLAVAVGSVYAGTATLNYNPSGTSPMRMTTDGSSNNLNNITVWDSVAGANGWTITAGGAGVTTPANGAVMIMTPTNGSIIAITPVANTLFPITGTLSATVSNNVTATIVLTSTSAALPVTAVSALAFTPTNAIFAITPSTGPLFVNVANANANGQATMANSAPVVVASNQTTLTTTIATQFLGQTAMASALPVAIASNQTPITVTQGGGLASLNQDPCIGTLKSFADVNTTANAGTLIQAVASKKNYICSMTIMVATASTPVSLIEGTGNNCAGGTSDAIWGAASTNTSSTGGTTFAVNGGLTHGNGNGMLAANTTANQNTCVQFSTVGTPTVAVHVGYVQQ